jgi:hypothetical protein
MPQLADVFFSSATATRQRSSTTQRSQAWERPVVLAVCFRWNASTQLIRNQATSTGRRDDLVKTI